MFGCLINIVNRDMMKLCLCNKKDLFLSFLFLFGL